MRTSDQLDKLLPALLLARGKMKPAFKGKKNTFHNYSYANEEAWHDSIVPHLLDHELILAFSVSSYNRAEIKVSSNKGDRLTGLCQVGGTARVTHASGQWMEVDGVGEGEDGADKGAYKAMTGLKKYLYSLMFALPTTDDVEATEHDEQRAKADVKETLSVKDKVDQAVVNATFAAQGLTPEIDQDAKAKSKALFLEMKQLGTVAYKKAVEIKSNCGTDYNKMNMLLGVAIREELEGSAQDADAPLHEGQA